jgi:hypothetical protein
MEKGKLPRSTSITPQILTVDSIMDGTFDDAKHADCNLGRMDTFVGTSSCTTALRRDKGS